MSELADVSGLQIDQDMQHQQREWKLQYWGWALMAILLLAALLGLFGPGPFNRTTISDNGFSIEYAKFDRYQAPSVLKLRVPGALHENDTFRIRVSRPFIGVVELMRMYPRPVAEELEKHWISYVFVAPAPGEDMEISFQYKGDEYGRHSAVVALDTKARVEFSQFFHP